MMIQDQIVKPSDVPLAVGWQIVDEVKSMPQGTMPTRWAITTSRVVSGAGHSVLDGTRENVRTSRSASTDCAVNTTTNPTVVSPTISVAETSISPHPIIRTNITDPKTDTDGGDEWKKGLDRERDTIAGGPVGCMYTIFHHRNRKIAPIIHLSHASEKYLLGID